MGVESGTCKLLALLIVAASSSEAVAQAYPTKPVRVIAPFAPGGPVDVLSRLIAEKLTNKLGQQFFVENQPGAGGNIGMGNGARAAPDGYTITVVGPSFVVNPSLFAKLPFDPQKDFAPVTLAAISANVLVVHPSLPAATAKDLVSYLTANPGKLGFAHPGIGTTAQLAGEMFRRSQSLDIAPVSFNGSAPAIQSVLGAHTPVGFTVITPAVAQVKEGKLRALAVTTSNRAGALPDVPTLAEAGFPDQESDTLLGVVVPAQTPAPLIAQLHREIAAAVAQLDTEGKTVALGFQPVANSPEAFATRIRADLAKWARVIEAAGIKGQ